MFFKRTGSNWAQEAYLKAPNVGPDDEFGYSVSIDGDTIAVGAYKEDSNQTTIINGAGGSVDNFATDSGAVYVFKRTGTSWAQQAYLKAPNSRTNYFFGNSVAIDADTIAVGSHLEASNQTIITNGPGASADNSVAQSGAVYVFKRSGNNWNQEAYIKATNANGSDQFGNSVALAADTIAVGAFYESSNQTIITNGTGASTNNFAGAAGAVYVYKRTGSNWAQEAYLKAPNVDFNDRFGESVAIDKSTIVVGAYNESSSQTTITNGTTASPDNGAGASGAAYVFKRTGDNWAQQSYLKASNTDANDYFGNSVAIATDTIAVGAKYEDSNQTTITNGTTASSDNSVGDAGAVYVFTRK